MINSLLRTKEKIFFEARRKTIPVISELQFEKFEAISSCMLRPSFSQALHINSINVIFFDGLHCLVLRMASYLDAFSTYPIMRSCTACFITTVTPEASEYRSSRTRYSFHSNNNAPSRYHTNCLAYIIPCLLIRNGVDYTITP